MKKISIILPVFNGERHLKECLQSICVSSKDFEVIVVDDGSNDGSADICKWYAKNDRRFKYFYKKNGGVSSARNYGIQKATGDYIMFVDADDKLSRNWDNILEIDYVHKIYYFSNISSRTKKEGLLKYITGVNDEHIFLSGPYSKCFSRVFLVDNNIKFNEHLINGEDMLFNIEAILCAESFAIVNETFYLYRQESGQTTRSFDERIIQSDKNFHNELNRVFVRYKVNSELALEIERESLKNAVILILYRLSCARHYRIIKKYYSELEREPYSSIIKEQDGLLYNLCRRQKYYLLYRILRMKNNISMLVRDMKNEKFVEI